MNNNKLIKISIGLIFLLFSSHAFSSSSGIVGFSGSSGSFCSVCHNSGIVPTVAIVGSNNVPPGSLNSYQFTITGGQNQIGGLNVRASSGTLSVQAGDTSIRKSGLELAHTQPATISAGTIAWSFDWQAPASPGTYTLFAAGVSANNDQSVSGDNAATDSLIITVASSGPTPVAIISSPLTALTGSSVTFDGSNSTPPTGFIITQYDWNIDGTDFLNSGAINVSSFASAGRHTATLAVTDSNNVSATTFADIIIGATTIPVVNHTGPYSGDAGTVINFDASGSTVDSSTALINYIWDFGDGSVIVQGASATTSHTYTNAGVYTTTIAAQDGNGMTGVAAVTVTINTVVVQPTTGEGIYNANCVACHGTAGVGTPAVPRSVQGATQTLILNALPGGSNAIPAMSGVTTLSPGDAQLVADYLAVTGSTGDALYIGRCQICHGVAGVGVPGVAPAVVGATRVMILNKIISVSAMSGVTLSNPESQLIADFLGSGSAVTGNDFYAVKCAICHGSTGTGIPGVAQAVKGATQSMILNAFNTIGIMDGIILSNNNTQLVADFLGTTNGTTGQEFFADKCAICHGAAGIGGIAPLAKGATNFMINAEVARVPDMAGIVLTGTQSQQMADYLGSGGSTGQDFYTNKCFICHGSNGTGNAGSIYNGGNIQNTNPTKYFNAIATKQEMHGILLDSTQASAIQGFLP